MVAPQLVGRETEIDVIRDLLARAEAQGAALALAGESGIGKSVLLDEARRAAEERGYFVLATAGVQAETNFPYAALHRLLRPLLPRIEGLPAPQRTAIAAAFGIEQAPAPVFLVGLAALTLLGDQAAAAPLLLLLDDTHWLDPLSAQVFGFLFRRLGADPIAALTACRNDDRPIEEAELPALAVPPLDTRSSEALLDSQAPDLSSKVRERVLLEAAGNPLALVELPIAWRSQPTPLPAIAALPLTERLEDAFSARFRELPAETRGMLLVAALEEDGAVVEIERAARSMNGGALPSWGPALDAGLVSIVKGTVRFRHPLLRSAIRQTSGDPQRHEAHAALAEALADQPDRSLWHRASSRGGPDEALASELEAAATAARERGAIATAKMALERAARLSPEPGKGARLLGAAELAHDLGRPKSVLWLLDEAGALPLTCADRTRLAWLREEIAGSAWSDGDRIRSLAAIAGEFAEEGEIDLALRCLLSAARRIWWTKPDRELGCLMIDAVERLPVDDHDPRLLAILAYADPIGRGAVVLERISETDPKSVGDPARLHLFGTAASAIYAFDLALDFLADAVEGLRAQGQVGLLAQALAAEAWAAMHLGKDTLSAEAADEAIRFAEETSQTQWVTVARLAQAAVLCERGRFDEAETMLIDAESVLMQTGGHSMLAMAGFARGRGAVAHGRYEEGLDQLGQVLRPGELSYHPFIGVWGLSELIEAAASLGDEDAARSHLAELESLVAATHAPMLVTELAYCEPLLADDDRAEALYEEALAGELTNWPYYRGRLLLSYGRWLRRHRRVADSRVPLRAAREIFDALAYDPLAESARQELRASGETSRRRSDDARDQLTPQELKIAQMAAAGRTNKEIGRVLFLSHRTVESHLYRMFPKLGITSRAELRDALPDAMVAEAPEAVGGDRLGVT